MSWIIPTAVFLAGVVMPGIVFGQPLCGDHDEIVAALAVGYEESRIGIGLSNAGGMIEVYTSPRGTWTMLLTTPDGQTCMIGAGDNWDGIAPPIEGTDT